VFAYVVGYLVFWRMHQERQGAAKRQDVARTLVSG
jgi:hypothetical protein